MLSSTEKASIYVGPLMTLAQFAEMIERGSALHAERAAQNAMPGTPPAGIPHTPGIAPRVSHIPTSPQK